MKEPLRTYKEASPQHSFYRDMHKNQTYNYALLKQLEYGEFGKRCRMTLKDALSMMDRFVDPSDPDLISTPNLVHAYQTAERIRRKYPHNYELQLCGLIHDVGKILFAFGEPAWAVVGDTYPLGCAFQKSIVYYDTMGGNPDRDVPEYCTKLGVYPRGCGMRNLTMAFGHDEYLYLVLRHNRNHKLSERYWNIIKFHSFYPWHTGKDYRYFMDESDKSLLTDLIAFNEFDLYSKEDSTDISRSVKKYYDDLLDYYFPEKLEW